MLIATLMAFTTMMAASDGQTPTDGETYYIYNIGLNKYLAAQSDGQLTLADEGIAITLEASTRSRHKLKYNSKALGTGMYDTKITCDGTAEYSDWSFSKVSVTGKTNVYAIGCFIKDSGANYYIYWNTATDKLGRQAYVPGAAFTEGLWQFISQADYERKEVLLDERSATYTQPSADANTTVTLRRTLEQNQWNTFCIPFALTETQLKAAFGEDVKLAKYDSNDNTTLYFSTVSTVEAATPYLIYPTSVSADTTYTFTDITAFSAETGGTTTGTTCDMKGFFCQTAAPAGSYIVSGGSLSYLATSSTLDGFRAYFEPNNSSTSLKKIQIDGIPTAINQLSNELQSDKVYNLNGQFLGTNAATLPSGVYIINGKKTVKK